MAKLGQAVKARRAELGLTQQDVAQAGGPSDTTQTGIENGTATAVSTATLRKLDFALGWASGSARHILENGGLPKQLRHAPASTDRSKFPEEQRNATVNELVRSGQRLQQKIAEDPDRLKATAGEVLAGIHASWVTANKALDLGAPAAPVQKWVSAGFELLVSSGLMAHFETDPADLMTLLDDYRAVLDRLKVPASTDTAVADISLAPSGPEIGAGVFAVDDAGAGDDERAEASPPWADEHRMAAFDPGDPKDTPI